MYKRYGASFPEFVSFYSKLLAIRAEDPFLHFMVGLCHIHHVQKRTVVGDPSSKLAQVTNTSITPYYQGKLN